MKESLRSILSRIVIGAQLAALGRGLRQQDGALILCGHRVSDDDEGYLQGLRPAWLDEQVGYLCRHHEVISLDRLVTCYEEKTQVPARSVVLTFDDGFLDNLQNAAPILQRHGATATVFLATDSTSSGQLPWSQRLGFLFQRSTIREVEAWGPGRVLLDLSGPQARRRSYLRVKALLAGLQRAEREEVLVSLSELLQVEPPVDRMLTWDDARELRAMGFGIGAHSHSHSLLARVPVAEARWEMQKSRDDIRLHLGIERPPFVFPGGSLNAGLVDVARELGFRSVTQRDRRRRFNNLLNTDQFALSRVGFPNAPGHVLEAELDGPFQLLRGLYRR